MFTHSSADYSPRILLVSDNAELSSHVIALLSNQPQLKNVAWELYYSYNNRSPEAMKALGAIPANLKDETTLKKIIAETDIVFSLHCKQIFPAQLIDSVTCINVHPGYNPYNRGWFPQIFSIINKLPAGVTIHLMDCEIDHGPIIYQQSIPIKESDTSLEVYMNIIDIEKQMLDKYFVKLIFGHYQKRAPEKEGNYNSIADFNKVCELDLNDVGTMKEHINILRALSHGELNNAYFIDVDGYKNYISIIIKPEVNANNPY